MATWLEDVQSALKSLGGQGTLDEIYRAVRALRPGNPPASWQAMIRKELEYHSSDSETYQGKQDLFYSVHGIGNGVWGLRQPAATLRIASDLGDVNPERVETTTYRVLRDTKLARALKRLHKNKCQICGLTIELQGGQTYAEAHHIRPLGEPHNGPDVAANIVVVCPNHHAALDFGAFELSQPTLRGADGHAVGTEFLAYHNNEIFKKKVD